MVEDDSLYDFSKFTAGPYIENAELTVEDGRYFITYFSRYEYSAIMNLHAEIILRPWRGYTCIKETYREKDWTIIA